MAHVPSEEIFFKRKLWYLHKGISILNVCKILGYETVSIFADIQLQSCIIMTSAREENLKKSIEEKVISVNAVYPGIISLIARLGPIISKPFLDQKWISWTVRKWTRTHGPNENKFDESGSRVTFKMSKIWFFKYLIFCIPSVFKLLQMPKFIFYKFWNLSVFLTLSMPPIFPPKL